MSDQNKSSRLESLLNHASNIEENIYLAITSNDNKQVDILSTEFEKIRSSILSFPIATFSDLKQKCYFGQKLIMLDHNDPSMVTDIFATLLQDIENINNIHNP